MRPRSSVRCGRYRRDSRVISRVDVAMVAAGAAATNERPFGRVVAIVTRCEAASDRSFRDAGATIRGHSNPLAEHARPLRSRARGSVRMRTSDRYFEEMYASNLDPWGYETKWYEKRKYAMTMAALPREHYRRAFEPGCSNGVLTSMLSTRCDELIAIDPIGRIVDRAAERNPGVSVRRGRIPEDWPPGTFDLIVLSEVLYYMDQESLELICRDVERSTGAHVVAVHWRGDTNYPMTGDGVHTFLDIQPRWKSLVAHDEPEFLLSVYEVS
ncbi:MAG: SAM-dependent methyltransferase [Kofleriaceae bacterium]